MLVPAWALSLSYWLHMLATIVWIGGLAAVSLVTLPLLTRLNDPAVRLNFLHSTQKRLDPLGWLSLAVLIATGLVQMSASDRYEGLLAIGNAWSRAILLKHIVFLGMIGLSAYLTWAALPELSRAVMRTARGKGETDEIDALFRKHRLILWGNLILGVLVLVFTALARVNA
jgi:uncharacterized membrane protein